MEDGLEAHVIAGIITGVILFVDLIVRIFLLFYIPRNRKPTAALAWLFAIYITPVIGTLFFLVIGSTKLSRNRRAMQRYINQSYRRYNRNLHTSGLASHVDPEYKQVAKLAESLAFLAPTSANKVTILNGYNRIIKDMTRAVDTAQHYVYVEFFAMTLDDTTAPFFDALERAIQRGVQVYVLFDTLGSHKYKGYKPMMKRLTAMGARWSKMLAIRLTPKQYNRPDLRNHRKILVIDNTDSYLGSLNMIDKTYHRKDDIYYVELVTHLEGPAVNESAAVFASDWYAETGEMLKHFMINSMKDLKGKSDVQILPSGPGYTYRNNLKVFVSLINSARSSVVITNPYLVPEESLLGAITSASLRGVKVSILNSESMDQWMVGHAQRSYYEELLKAGVTISLYKKPQLVHSKYMVVDEQIAIVGSSNLDVRSFELNQECSVIIYDQKIAHKLHKQHVKDLEMCTQQTLAHWRMRSQWSKFLDSVSRLTSALQ